MSTGAAMDLRSTYTAWDDGVRKRTDNFMADGSMILIKIVSGERQTIFRVRIAS